MIGSLLSNVIAICFLLFSNDNLTDFVVNESAESRDFVLVAAREIRAKIVRITLRKIDIASLVKHLNQFLKNLS